VKQARIAAAPKAAVARPQELPPADGTARTLPAPVSLAPVKLEPVDVITSWCDIFLVVTGVAVGLLQLCLLLGTLRATREAASAAEKAANATEKSVKAQLDSARPWLLVIPAKDQTPLSAVKPENQRATCLLRPGAHPQRIRLRIVNEGKSPGRLRYLRVKAGTQQSDTVREYDNLLVPHAYVDAIAVNLSAQQIAAIVSGREKLSIEGKIEYLDQANRRCDTNFYLEYLIPQAGSEFPEGFIFSGGVGANRAT
jgi:hypothetical protein